MTEIVGKGFGDSHDWENKGTENNYIAVERSTLFVCRACGESFRHWYHIEPDIFEAMKQSNVKETCKKE